MRLHSIVPTFALGPSPLLRLVAIAGLYLGASCANGDSGPSALLITFDTTRADAISSFGGEPGITPNIDALVAEGVAYDRAYAVTPMTQPSHASMLTGLYPPRHRVRINGHRPLPASAETLAEMAQAAGMQTAAFVSAVVLDKAFGLDQGFETYDVPNRRARGSKIGFTGRTVKEVTDLALSWFEARDRDRPFFVWIHVWDPHPPWNPPPQFRARAQNKPYLAEVAFADAVIGRLLSVLDKDGTLDETTVVFVADHGEAFGEHGEESHSTHCYESTMRVPFVIRYPDRFMAGERIAVVTSIADVQPTLAEALGLTGPENVDGRSLYRRTSLDDRGAYIESYYGYMSFSWSPLAGWVDAEGKYLHSSSPEFYDMRTDLGETTNLHDAHPEASRRYRDAIVRVASQPALELADEATIDESLREDLEKVGYASSNIVDEDIPHPLAESDLPSPATSMEERKLTIEVLSQLSSGRIAEGMETCRRILETNPNNCWALDRLASCYVREKQWEEALVLLQRTIQNGRATANTYGNLGGCLLSLGRKEEALASFLMVLDLDPYEPLSLLAVVRLLRETGRHAESEPYAERYEQATGVRL